MTSAGKKPILQWGLLLLLPLVFLLAGLRFDRTRFGTDPESAYLMNGLNIAMLLPVGHYDHPGTPVQTFNAAVLRVTHLLRASGTGIETDVLEHPEYYTEVLRKSLIVLNALILLLAGFVILLLLKNLWAALLLQLTPFVSATLTEILYTKVAPEPMLFTVTMLLIMATVYYYTMQQPNQRRFAVLFGILTGLGVATKFTFLPLAVIPFIILPGWRNRWVFAAVMVAAFFVFTLPAARSYPQMAGWVLNLGTHTGTYGQGSKGLIDLHAYRLALKAIAFNNPALVISLFAATALLIALFAIPATRQKLKKLRETPYLLAVTLAQLGSILLVAKHYHSNHYLFPALTLTCFSWILNWLLLQKLAENKTARLPELSLPLILLILTAAASTNKPYLLEAWKGYRQSNSDTDQAQLLLDTQYRDFTKVYYYPTSFNNYSSLRWGNVYARQLHTAALEKLYPEGLFFDIRNGSFQRWETNFTADEFVKKYGGKLLLVGGPKTAGEMDIVSGYGLSLKKRYEGRLQVIYEIDTAASAIFHQARAKLSPEWKMNCDFETLSADKQWIMVDGEVFCRNEHLQSAAARSGKNAVELKGMDAFGMNYLLKNPLPGQKYELSVWRKSSTGGSSLAVASADAGKFYHATEKAAETDPSGWQKLVIDFEVPADFTEKELKIYLWNHDAGSALFDDFSLIRYK